MNVVWPGRLWTLTVPWCATTTALTMARPSPVLPAARDREESPRAKRSNSSGTRSGGTPWPLSVTLSRTAESGAPGPEPPDGCQFPAGPDAAAGPAVAVGPAVAAGRAGAAGFATATGLWSGDDASSGEPSVAATATVTVESGGVCLAALLSRLLRTWRSRSSSPRTISGSSGSSSCHRWDRLATCASLVASMVSRVRSTGSCSSGRPASRRASRRSSSTRTLIRADSDSTRLSACVTSSGTGPRCRRASSAYPRMAASGVRSSWLASAANRRSRVSLAARRARADSTCWSIRLNAAPTWPTSVRGSSSGTRADRLMSVSSGSSVTMVAVAATRRSGRSDSRTSTTPEPATSRTTTANTTASAISTLRRVSSTVRSGRPV